jgi:serine/threonine-protein kinase
MKYRLTEKIGSGGMAEVFRAVGVGPERFERPFVVKRIHPRLSGAPEFVRMFVDEATISARLIHPNIVQVFEFALHDGAYYLVMEPVDGIDMGWLLRRRIERPSEQLSPAFVAEVGRQVCRGLEFAHTLADVDGKPLDIVHRDVTPPNIMVAWNGTVKILDFGLARAAEALRLHQSDAGMIRGKMAYLAPELLQGAQADARSDLFSLGVVMHELLSGQRLFVGANDFETLQQVQGMPIPRPSSRNPGVKPALDAVVMRALEREPARRYKSAAEMGDELEALVLRKNYSPRALARKALELGEQDTPAQRARPTPLAGAAPEEIGREDSSVVVDESRTAEVLVASPPATGEARAQRGLRRWLAFGKAKN